MTTNDKNLRFEGGVDLYGYWKSLPSAEDKRDFICGNWTLHMPHHSSVKENWFRVAHLFVKLAILKDEEFLDIIKKISGTTKFKKSLVLRHIDAPNNNLLYILLNEGFSRNTLDLTDKTQKKLYDLILSLVEAQMGVFAFPLDYSWIKTSLDSWDRGFMADLLFFARDKEALWKFFSPMLSEISKYIPSHIWGVQVGGITQDAFVVEMNFAHFFVYKNFKTHQNVVSLVEKKALSESILFNGNSGNIMDLLLLTEDDELSRGGHLFRACPDDVRQRMVYIFDILRDVLKDVPATKFGVKSLVGVMSLNLNVEVCRSSLEKYISFFPREMFKAAVDECLRDIHPDLKTWLKNN